MYKSNFGECKELQKVVAKITMEKVNTQEPPLQPPIATRGQPQEQQAQDVTAKVTSIVLVTTTTEEQD